MLVDYQERSPATATTEELRKFQLHPRNSRDKILNYHNFLNDSSVPKALVPRNTMNVCLAEITWLSGESF